jgi:molecular chaperone DnaJ
MKDYYKILDVEKNASKDEIKKQYRKKAMEYHPDVNDGNKISEDKFKDLSEAYDVLSDDNKKSKYDRELNGNNIFSNFENFNTYSNFYNFNEFDKFYSSRKPNSRKQNKGLDIKATIDITLVDILNGYNKKIKIRKDIKCSDCDGFGYINNIFDLCGVCEGRGYSIKENISDRSSFFRKYYEEVSCENCEGTGKIYLNICQKCKGKGIIKDDAIININIPRGFNSDSIIFKENGNAIKNGINGDFYLNVNIIEDERFIRKNNDIYYNLHIKILDAIFGSKVIVPTLHGDVILKISEGIQNGKILRLNGKGFPDEYGINYGNQYINIIIDIPTELTEEEKDIFNKLNSDKFLFGEKI